MEHNKTECLNCLATGILAEMDKQLPSGRIQISSYEYEVVKEYSRIHGLTYGDGSFVSYNGVPVHIKCSATVIGNCMITYYPIHEDGTFTKNGVFKTDRFTCYEQPLRVMEAAFEIIKSKSHLIYKVCAEVSRYDEDGILHTIGSINLH